MMYLGMALLLPATWFLPWWTAALISFALGWMSGPRIATALQLSLACGLVNAALAFMKDARNGGIISQRMSQLFALPYSPLIFLAVFVIAFVTAFLCFQAGAALSALYKAKAISRNSAVPK